MATLPSGKILICGGYSKLKVKKDVDKGVNHTDAYLLTPESRENVAMSMQILTANIIF